MDCIFNELKTYEKKIGMFRLTEKVVYTFSVISIRSFNACWNRKSLDISCL